MQTDRVARLEEEGSSLNSDLELIQLQEVRVEESWCAQSGSMQEDSHCSLPELVNLTSAENLLQQPITYLVSGHKLFIAGHQTIS